MILLIAKYNLKTRWAHLIIFTLYYFIMIINFNNIEASFIECMQEGANNMPEENNLPAEAEAKEVDQATNLNKIDDFKNVLNNEANEDNQIQANEVKAEAKPFRIAPPDQAILEAEKNIDPKSESKWSIKIFNSINDIFR